MDLDFKRRARRCPLHDVRQPGGSSVDGGMRALFKARFDGSRRCYGWIRGQLHDHLLLHHLGSTRLRIPDSPADRRRRPIDELGRRRDRRTVASCASPIGSAPSASADAGDCSPPLLIIGLAPIDHGSFLTVMVILYVFLGGSHYGITSIGNVLPHCTPRAGERLARDGRQGGIDCRPVARRLDRQNSAPATNVRGARTSSPSWQSRRSHSASSNDAARYGRRPPWSGRSRGSSRTRTGRCRVPSAECCLRADAHHVLNAIDLAHHRRRGSGPSG